MEYETVKQIPGDLSVVLTGNGVSKLGKQQITDSVGSSQGSKIAKQI